MINPTAMTKKEKIIDRLKKLGKMRDGGEAGERVNAAALMEEIMRRHGIREEDLEEEENEFFWLQVPDKMHFKLFSQMIGLIDDDANVKLRFMPDIPEKLEMEFRGKMKGIIPDGEEYNVAGFAKRSTFAEAMARYKMYDKDFQKNMDMFFYAYLFRNDLLVERKGDETEANEKEMEDIMASIRMSQNIRRAEVLRQLEKGGGK